MRQKEVKALLEEAAKPGCSWQRRTEIQCQLCEATAAMGKNGVYKIKGRKAAFHMLLNDLYMDTLNNRPDLLPTLFPFFAVICGDRKEGYIVADHVDWGIVG